ncbi:MAG TPA: SRPBCC family protein [Solirubrobacterales bacterium]|nr:SRPBCC family protein [Solirubrobacterales bacterium]
MAYVRGQIVIERPVEEVFDFVADERNVYDPRIVSAEKLTDGPVGGGTRFRSETRGFGGRVVPMLVELRTYERPRRLASTTRAAGIEIDSALDFEPVPEGTSMRWVWEVRPQGALRLLRPLLGPIARRQARTIWSSLKRELEEGREGRPPAA